MRGQLNKDKIKRDTIFFSLHKEIDLLAPGLVVDREGKFKLSYKLFNLFKLVSFKNYLEENPYACFCSRYYSK